MNSNSVIYQPYSNTIRQVPENYLIAYRRIDGWICDPDLAANKELCTIVFLELFNLKSKYGTGDELLMKIKSVLEKNY